MCVIASVSEMRVCLKEKERMMKQDVAVVVVFVVVLVVVVVVVGRKVREGSYRDRGE